MFLFSILVSHDLELKKIDVKIVFLNLAFDEDILLMQAKGFEFKGKNNHSCLLKNH